MAQGEIAAIGHIDSYVRKSRGRGAHAVRIAQSAESNPIDDVDF